MMEPTSPIGFPFCFEIVVHGNDDAGAITGDIHVPETATEKNAARIVYIA